MTGSRLAVNPLVMRHGHVIVRRQGEPRLTHWRATSDADITNAVTNLA